MNCWRTRDLRPVGKPAPKLHPGAARWFGGVAPHHQGPRASTRCSPFPDHDHKSYLLFVDLDYVQGDIERYLFATRLTPPATRRSKSSGAIRTSSLRRLRLRKTGVEGFYF